jgi:endonuclease/exonuclease/phosphatase family metal-dependent hydrolase
VLVLTWNLFHGRSVPDTPRSLRGEFAGALAAWDWDVALLQEVPPWWPPALAGAAGASERTALTSRNQLPALRRAIAERRPDVIKSDGGGANAILVRGATIAEHRVHTLRRWPERRVVHGVLLDTGVWVSNLHAQAHSKARAQADLAAAAAHTLAWAGDAPAVLGGDANLRAPAAGGFVTAGGHGVDHVLAHGLEPAGAPKVLDSVGLSDHDPVLVDLI